LASSPEYVTILHVSSLRGYFICSYYMTTPVVFLRETYDEIKKVVWPTRNEVIRLTLVVITISILTGLYIGGLDYIFTKITELIVK